MFCLFFLLKFYFLQKFLLSCFFEFAIIILLKNLYFDCSPYTT